MGKLKFQTRLFITVCVSSTVLVSTSITGITISNNITPKIEDLKSALNKIGGVNNTTFVEVDEFLNTTRNSCTRG